jgi:hypothetical protein
MTPQAPGGNPLPPGLKWNYFTGSTIAWSSVTLPSS